MDKMQYHKELCDKIQELYRKKNSDYGNSVNDTFQKFGIDAFLVRMYDKINRVYSLTRPGVKTMVKDEKIEDTLLDLANYAIIALVEMKAEQNKLVCTEELADESSFKITSIEEDLSYYNPKILDKLNLLEGVKDDNATI